MSLITLLPISLGLMTVLQNVLNRQVGDRYGLIFAVFLNALIGLLIAALLVLLARYFPHKFPTNMVQGATSILQWRHFLPSLKWWYILPGTMGLFIVFGLPYALSYYDASTVFISFVAAQILGSLLWDRFVDGLTISPYKIAGAILAVFSVFLISQK